MKRGVFPVAGCDEAGQGAARGSGGRRRGHPRSQAHSQRAQRFQEAERRNARDALREDLRQCQVAIAIAPPARIDVDNIRGASLWALARAVKALPVAPKLVFVDGIDRIDVDCECKAVISGDALVLSIAAASIVAKVTRDRLMGCLGAAHPGYGFERHMGYSVPEHFAALNRLGPCVHHRRKFAPVAALLGVPAVRKWMKPPS